MHKISLKMFFELNKQLYTSNVTKYFLRKCTHKISLNVLKNLYIILICNKCCLKEMYNIYVLVLHQKCTNKIS